MSGRSARWRSWPRYSSSSPMRHAKVSSPGRRTCASRCSVSRPASGRRRLASRGVSPHGNDDMIRIGLVGFVTIAGTAYGQETLPISGGMPVGLRREISGILAGAPNGPGGDPAIGKRGRQGGAGTLLAAFRARTAHVVPVRAVGVEQVLEQSEADSGQAVEGTRRHSRHTLYCPGGHGTNSLLEFGSPTP